MVRILFLIAVLSGAMLTHPTYVHADDTPQLEIPAKIEQELLQYRQQKKELYNKLSAEAKAALKNRRQRYASNNQEKLAARCAKYCDILSNQSQHEAHP